MVRRLPRTRPLSGRGRQTLPTKRSECWSSFTSKTGQSWWESSRTFWRNVKDRAVAGDRRGRLCLWVRHTIGRGRQKEVDRCEEGGTESQRGDQASKDGGWPKSWATLVHRHRFGCVRGADDSDSGNRRWVLGYGQGLIHKILSIKLALLTQYQSRPYVTINTLRKFV